MVIFLPRAGDYLRRAAIGIYGVIALLCNTHLLTVVQRYLHQRRRLLDHSSVTGLAALGCQPVNAKRGMSFSVSLLLLNNRQGLLAEASNLMLREG
ncbi:hypothetical protein D3C86_1802080 [compost metagenome]